MADVCHLGGWLVPVDLWLPEDARHASWSAALPIGCNRLRCEVCGEDVTQVVEDGRRRYTCGCGQDVEVLSARPCDPTHAEMPHARAEPLPWRCQGHERVTLPTVLDGVALGRQALGDTLAGVMRGATPPDAGIPAKLGARQPGLWLAQLYRRLADAQDQEALGVVVSAAAARAGTAPAALNALRWTPELHRQKGLAKALAAPPADAGPHLAEAAQARLTKVAAGKVKDDAFVDAAFGALGRGVAVSGLVYTLARLDLDRTVAAGRAAVAADREQLEFVASALEDHDAAFAALLRGVVADGSYDAATLTGPDAMDLLGVDGAEKARRILGAPG
ncbi:MAG: hypothetical protein KC635_10735 [Myxococcales bacterium]|nr:hypothetical protein [Myxococcales bacterium]MCB9737297.1 hypothetical protein [Deltaproteobacteria bacterium]